MSPDPAGSPDVHADSSLGLLSPPAATRAAHRRIAFDHDRVARGVLARTSARRLDTRAWSRIRLLVDVVLLCLASGAALLASPLPHGAASLWLAAFFPVLVLVILDARRAPDSRLQASALDSAVHVLGVVSIAAVLTIAFDSITRGGQPTSVGVRLWLFAFLFLAAGRIALLSIRRHAASSGALVTPTLIVGSGAVGGHVCRRLASEPAYGLRPVGFLDSNPLPALGSKGPAVPILGGLDDLAEAIERTGARQVILAFSSDPDRVLVEVVRQCHRLGIEVSIVPRLYESISERSTLDYVGGLPLCTLPSTDPHGWPFAVKHALDRGIATLALLVFAPLMLAIAIAVRLTSPGPVLFRQRRVGRDGHEFDALKFRTMHVSDSPDQWFALPEGCAPGGVEGRDRRTKVGRMLRDWSLDELPQLINVLRGDMSLVGPRPERPQFVERFSAEVYGYQNRHRVKSGITGWAQVHGLRGQTSIADRVEWDNYYIQNWSLRLDLRIIALTVVELLRLRHSG